MLAKFSIFLAIATVTRAAGLIISNISTYPTAPVSSYSSVPNFPVPKTRYVNPYSSAPFFYPPKALYSASPPFRSHSSTLGPIIRPPYNAGPHSYATQPPLHYKKFPFTIPTIATHPIAPLLTYPSISSPVVKIGYVNPYSYATASPSHTPKTLYTTPTITTYSPAASFAYSSISTPVLKTGYSSTDVRYADVPVAYTDRAINAFGTNCNLVPTGEDRRDE